MSKNKTGKRGLKIGKISSSHKGICVHTPSGKKIFIDENTAMYKFLRQKLIDECVSPQTVIDDSCNYDSSRTWNDHIHGALRKKMSSFEITTL